MVPKRLTEKENHHLPLPLHSHYLMWVVVSGGGWGGMEWTGGTLCVLLLNFFWGGGGGGKEKEEFALWSGKKLYLPYPLYLLCA